MSALGHKRTFALQEGMSALHPKADMCSALGDVRFVPIADIRGISLGGVFAGGESNYRHNAGR